MDSSALTLLASVVLMAIAVLGAWRALDQASERRGAGKIALMGMLLVGGVFILFTSIILTARGACALLDCRGYLEAQQAVSDVAPPPPLPPADR